MALALTLPDGILEQQILSTLLDGWQPAADAVSSFLKENFVNDGTRLFHVHRTRVSRTKYWAFAPSVGKIAEESVVMWVDDNPGASWQHPCRYVIFDKNGGMVIIHSISPPFYGDAESEGQWALLNAQARDDDLASWPWEAAGFPTTVPTASPNEEREAILISGMTDSWSLNNLEYTFRMLTHQLGLPVGRIRVVSLNGNVETNGGYFPPDHANGLRPPYQSFIETSIPSVTALEDDGLVTPGTKTSLLRRLGRLARRCPVRTTRVLMFFDGHGGTDVCGSYLQLYAPDQKELGWQESRIYPYDLEKILSHFPEHKDLTVVMNQCYAGGFRDAVFRGSRAQNTLFYGASSATGLTSRSTRFGNFSKAWTTAWGGDGDIWSVWQQSNTVQGGPVFKAQVIDAKACRFRPPV